MGDGVDGPPASVTLEAVLDRITYSNAETGYTVARVTPAEDPEPLTVVGTLPGAQPGESLRLAGRWTTHPKYGPQFEVDSYDPVPPATERALRRYLASGLVEGIGPRLAERIVDAFGADALTVVDEAPERLAEVAGLGPRRTAQLLAAWRRRRSIRTVMEFLTGVGVPAELAVRIHRTYGDGSVATVRDDPYRLPAEVPGIGFGTADTIALAVGIGRETPRRVRAGLLHALTEAAADGHCFLPEPALVVAARRILGVDAVLIRDRLAELAAAEGVVREDVPGTGPDGAPVTVRAVYLPAYHRAEISLANGLLRLLHNGSDRLTGFADVDWDRAFGWLARRTGTALSAGQRDAVRHALTSRLSVVAGGPGTGTGVAIASAAALALARDVPVLLVAPTGQAARRLSALAGHPATTLHQLLRPRPGGPGHDRTHPLPADLIVVDEVSTVDLVLADRLVRAVAGGAHLVLVGDADRLPSVGPGQVLRDLLAADGVPRTRLSEVFETATPAGVVANAHRIERGTPPVTAGLPDFFLFGCEDPEETADLVVDVVTRRMPGRFDLDPVRDIQVLTPTRDGPAGAAHLNALLQRALAPADDSRAERWHGGRVLRVGDRVAALRDNDATGVTAGTVGRVTELSPADERLTVTTDDDGPVAYPFAELDEIGHAYALAIDRAGGAEYPAVVVPVPAGAALDRELLYTAVTRARRLVVLVGSRDTLARAVRAAGPSRRHTSLTHRLTSA